MNIIRGTITNVRVVHDLLDPIDMALDRWYKRDAENVVHIEHSSIGVISITTLGTTRYTATNFISEEEIKSFLPRGKSVLYDCLSKEVIHWDGLPTYPKDLWLCFPMMGDTPVKDFSAYMAGDSEGNILACHGHSRNLVLGLFAQSRCWVFIGDREQTQFGRTLAGTIILKRWGLPPFNRYAPKVDHNYRCRDEPKDIPEECFKALTAIDTSPVKQKVEQLALAIIPKEQATPSGGLKKEQHVDPYIDLSFLLEIGLSGLEDELTFPYTVGFEKCPEYNLFNVKKIVLSSPSSVSVFLDTVEEETMEVLEILFSDYDLQIIAPDYSMFMPADSDIGMDSPFGMDSRSIPTGPIGIPETFDKEDQL